ncbi:hypothetical protein EC988_008067 [Linderina pennispora]|nr:hypothetical protein EC988_008067 [Linderina pennispora]
MVNELFSSLLGQRVPKNMLEEDSDNEGRRPGRSVTETMVNSGEISVGGDGMRLFG